MTEGDQGKRPNRKIRALFMGVFVVLAAVVVAGALIFWQHNHTDNSDEGAKEAQSQEIVQEVGKLYLLPANETPTVAKIQDVGKLQQTEKFYQGAKNGDFLLVYSKSQIALIYRQSANRLVTVSPINTMPNGATSDKSISPSVPAQAH